MTRNPELPSSTNTAGTCELCLDEALVAEVLEVSRSGDLAEVGIDGQAFTVATDLVGTVEIGDRLLIHAGFAIARVEG